MHTLARKSVRLFASLALAAFALPSFAIVATTGASTPVDTSYLYVGQVNGSSAVAVAPNKFLTARHVGAGDFVLGGATYTTTSSVFAPAYTISPGVTTNVDLVLVTVAGTLPGFYNVGATGTIVANSAITMVGYGSSGGVDTAGGTNPAGTPFAAQTGYALNVGAGTRRAGDNTTDVFGVINVGNSVGINATGGGPVVESYVFSAGDAALAERDSGGGWFANGALVGISSFIFNNTQNNRVDKAKYANYGFASRNTSGFNSITDSPNYTGPAYSFGANEAYFGSGAINLTDPQILGWLSANGVAVQAVPEPAPFAALGLGALALLRRRRRA